MGKENGRFKGWRNQYGTFSTFGKIGGGAWGTVLYLMIATSLETVKENPKGLLQWISLE